MKKILLSFFSLAFFATYGQDITIPDYNYEFTNYLLYHTDVDTNGDEIIQVSEAEALITLDIWGSQIIYLDGIENFVNLQSFSAVDTGIYNFTMPAMPNLETLFISSESVIQTIDVSNCTNLHGLGISLWSTSGIDSVILGYQPNLESLTIFSTQLQSLDLSLCPALNSLGFFDTYSLEYLNLKNGNPNIVLTDTNDGGNAKLGNNCVICVDEGEEDNITVDPYFLDQPNNIVITNYCSFTPGGDYKTIICTATFDENNNGCDAGDAAIPFLPVQISNGTYTATTISSGGTFSFYTLPGTFTLTPVFENSYFTTDTATVTFTENSPNTVTQNFCVTSSGVHNDAEVVVTPFGQAQPGFDALYKIVYKNKGNQTLSGDITLTFDDAVLDFVSASPVVTTSATGSLGWAYTNLLPFESREILVSLNVNSPAESPAVNIGDVLTYSVGITPLTGDENPFDNTFNLKQTVTGSFDPNDITCLEGATVNPDRIGEYLHYSINFENTGTAPATFVVVKDMVDVTQYDINTLQVLNASHSLETRVTDNKVEFVFDAINLAANGKGNVTFKIKSLNSLAVNSSVSQQADITFDFNLPIVTNVATTTYTLLGTTGFGKDASVKVYPNPATNVVSIAAESTIQSVQLFDVQGRLLDALNVNDVTATLDIASRAKGIYFIKIATDKGVNVAKLVKE